MAKGINMEKAIEYYYSKPELCNDDIKEIFNISGSSKVASLKKEAQKEMAACDILPWSAYCVETECAYRAWGIDVKKLEARFTRMKKIFPERSA